MKKFRVIAVIMVLALMMCSCGSAKTSGDDLEEDLTPTSSLTIDEEEAAVLNEGAGILYLGDEQQTKLIKKFVMLTSRRKRSRTLPRLWLES